MKKIIFSFIFILCSISINAYNNVTYIGCDCCRSVIKCIPIYFKNDTVIYAQVKKIYNDINKEYTHILHYKKYESKDKINIDSLKTIDNFDSALEFIKAYNYVTTEDLFKKYKHGVILDWSWSTNSVNGIDFNINYLNTNKKTIKYIEIYFYIKNPVNDICKIKFNNGSNICKLKCVGPIEYKENGSYSWDACYYTTGDAEYLHFTKLVITYMDNTKYTLAKEITYLENIE